MLNEMPARVRIGDQTKRDIERQLTELVRRIVDGGTHVVGLDGSQRFLGRIYTDNDEIRWLLLRIRDRRHTAENQQSEVSEEQNKLRKLLNMSVNEIELSVRAANCLNNANITTVGELAMKTEQEMLKYRNFGKKSLNEIKEKLEALGLSLGMKFDERLLDTKKEG